MAREIAADESELRTLDVTDEERTARFRRAGDGGTVSDALDELGPVRST